MARIGQILSQSVPLSAHDVEEILYEQKTTRQPFGSIALALGKADPEQVWDAWLTQLRQQPVDLGRVSPDATAVTALPAGLATAYRLVPLRVRSNQLVVATATDVPASTLAFIERRCGLQLIVAQASRVLVDQALARLYPASAAPEAA